MGTALSSPSSFKAKNTVQLELPSGESALCKRGGIEMFLRSGKVPNSLMPIMKAALGGNAKVKEATEELEVNADTIVDMFEMFDLVATQVMVNPRCHTVPEDEANRKDDLLYTDEVSVEDKQFLFQWAVGGTADIEKFREQSANYVASLQASSEVPSAPLPPPPAE